MDQKTTKIVDIKAKTYNIKASWTMSGGYRSSMSSYGNILQSTDNMTAPARVSEAILKS